MGLKIFAAISIAFSPEILTIPIPPGAFGVAMAAIVRFSMCNPP